MSNKVEIVVEARTASAVANMGKLASSTSKAKSSSDELAASQKKQAQALEITRARLENTTQRFASFDAAVKKANATANAGGSSVTSLGARIAGLKAPIAVGIAAIAGLAVAANELANASLQTQAVFANLAFSIEPARRATHGLVSDMELAATANRLVALGVTNNSQEFARLAAAAQALGQKLGITTESAFESLTAAVGRGSTMMLDNLGIVVKHEQAHKMYADSLGKTVDKLTDAEKAEAFRKVALEAIFKAAGDVTVVTDGAAAATKRYAVELENLKTGALGGHDRVLNLAAGLAELTQKQRDALVSGEKHQVAADNVRKTLIEMGVPVEQVAIGMADMAKAAEFATLRLHQQADAAEYDANKLHDVAAEQAEIIRLTNELNARAERAGALRDIEGRIAAREGGEKNIIGLKLQQAHLEAQMLEETGKHAEAVEKVREAENEAANATSKHASAKKQLTAEQLAFNRALAAAQGQQNLTGGALSRAGSDSREFAGQLAQAKQAEVGAQFRRAEKSPQELEEERLKRLEEAKDAAAEAAKVRHDEELARQQELQARQQAAAQVIGGSVQGLAVTMVQAGDFSAKGFKRVLREWGKTETIRLTVTAITEGIQALVSLASFNYPAAALHGAAAAAAGAAAVVVGGLTAATGGFGGAGATKNVKGFSGADFGGGPATPAANDRPQPTSSQKDTVPVSPQEAAQQAGSSGSSSGGVHYHFAKGSVTTLGTIDEKTGMKIGQGVEAARRRLGKTG